ncbi:MAG: hypothetical protein ABEJ69_01290 [Candidatus Nanohaloarchaea archaeon]
MAEFVDKLSEELSYPSNSSSASNRGDRAYINPWNLMATLQNKGFVDRHEVDADDDLEYGFGQRIRPGDEVEIPLTDPDTRDEYLLRMFRQDEFVELAVSPVDAVWSYDSGGDWQTVYTEVLGSEKLEETTFDDW